MQFEGVGKKSKKLLDFYEPFLDSFPISNKAKYYVKTSTSKFIDYLECQTYNFLGKFPEEMKFENCEGLENYNFALPHSSSKCGMSAFIRAKNEEDKIYVCLKSIIDVFDEIILVDNQSDDNTVSIAQKFKDEFDLEDKIKIFNYPHVMAKFGSEYNQSPENSVRNFAYFSNYTLSKCSYKYVCKWDADMVFRAEMINTFREFVDRLNRATPAVWNLYGQTVYKDASSNYWKSRKEIYYEPRIFPHSYLHTYAKGRYFEILKSPSLNLSLNLFTSSQSRDPILTRKGFREIAFYEIKSLGQNEFSHWTAEDVAHTPRKRKEIEAFELLKDGNIKEHENFEVVTNL